jgi:hypothetical protein
MTWLPLGRIYTWRFVCTCIHIAYRDQKTGRLLTADLRTVINWSRTRSVYIACEAMIWLCCTGKCQVRWDAAARRTRALSLHASHCPSWKRAQPGIYTHPTFSYATKSALLSTSRSTRFGVSLTVTPAFHQNRIRHLQLWSTPSAPQAASDTTVSFSSNLRALLSSQFRHHFIPLFS